MGGSGVQSTRLEAPAAANMVWIPGGTFRMGLDKRYPEEAPVHRVTISGFWIDRTPVTNRQFKQFVRATGQRIALSDIKNVNYSPYMSPPQVTLSVRRTPCSARQSLSAHRSAYFRSGAARSSMT